MKKKMALLSSALIFASVAQVANASGKVTVVGGVSDTTCNVTVNKNGPDATLTLPMVRPAALQKEGDTAGRMFLNFELSGCASAADLATKARVYFEASNTINSDGRLINTATDNAVKNVDIQVLNGDMTPINLTDVNPQHTTEALIDATTGTASLRHYVQYYKVGKEPTAPGQLTTSIEYNIEYL